MAALTQLEKQVQEFVAAIKHADYHLLQLPVTPAPPLQPSQNGSTTAPPKTNQPPPDTQQNRTNTTQAPSQPVSDNQQNGISNPHTSANDANSVHVNQQEDIATKLSSALTSAQADVEKRQSFLEMRREWMVWGQGLMRTLEAWLDRRDIGIADRMRLVGLADRMGWYGIGMAGRS